MNEDPKASRGGAGLRSVEFSGRARVGDEPRTRGDQNRGLTKEVHVLGNMISVAHAGGQGKTTLAQLLYICGRRSGGQFKLAAADFLDDSGRSKIGKLYPGRVMEFGTGANLTAVRSENNMNASVRYWDELGNLFLTGGHILDMGANVVKSVFEWAEDRRLSTVLARKGAPKFDIFCICKAEKHATDDVQRLVQMIGTGNALRPRHIYIVLNEAAGNFGPMGLQEKLTSANKELNLIFTRLPRCQSEIWAPMERFGVSIERALDMSEDEISQALDVDIWTASAGLAELKSWFDAAFAEFKSVGVFSNEML
jgi:hypothetical protein